jgi:hypothetical protein
MSWLIGLGLFAVACGVLDWLRGRSFMRFRSGEILYGLWVGLWAGYFIGAPSWFGPTFAVLFALGAVLGWGHPIGLAMDGATKADPERWQFHRVLVDSAPLALAVRGIIWAAPTLPLAYWEPQVLWMAAILPLSFLIAPYAAAKLAARFEWHYQTRWEVMEGIRGVITGICLGVVWAI